MKNKKTKNSIKTPSYFIKRLRDSGFIVWKIFSDYGMHDPRCWTILVDPSGSSVFITCYLNKDFFGDVMFELNDGGRKFLKNFSLKTESLEVIITHLLSAGVSNDPKNSPYQKDKYFHGQQGQQQKETNKNGSEERRETVST
jgi:hypothetical protein